MARFSIKDKETGVAKYSGSPVYNGTYLKPSFLSFQRVSSAALIPWKVGDHIDYPRTGLRYYLYTLPPVKKQARSGESGEAFTYDDVRLYSREKDLEICPFRDLVPQDNEIHFSTQPSISTYENVYGIGRRFQECLNDLYPGEWEVRVVTSNAPEDAEFIEMISEPRDFTVSGVSILGGLDKVYEVWPLCGWIYSFENGKNVLTIGGANIQAAKAAATSWSYGKGNGITDIRQNFANDGEIVNRLYVYGANRNIQLNYYNRLQIKDAESVDIEHLMLPLSRWGLTDGLPDARKAYIENATSVAKYGVRPKTVYFDGSDSENPAIFPSIQKATIGDIRAAMGYVTTTPYYPSSRYSDSERADKIVSVVNPSDDGDASTNGKQYESGTIAVSISGQSVEVSTGQDAGAILLGYYTPSYLAGSKVYIKPSITGQFNLISGTVAPAAILYVCKQAAVGGAMQGIVDSKVVPVNKASNSQFTFTINENILASYESASGIYLYLYVYTEGIPIDTPIIDPSEASAEYTLSVSGSASVEVSKSLAKRFTVRLKQIGFDINERAALGDGKTISFKTGMCAGRTFEIESASYDSTNDQWVLSVWRCVDTSLNQYFPNTSYQIAADDEFVLLDIAMPDIYVGIGENRLLAYGEDLLDYLSSPQINLDPGIDAKYVNNESRTLKEGMYILVTDSDIIESATPSMVDTITINEGVSNIPTYKVTLRERKRKTWTETVDSALNENTQSVRDYVSSSQSIADYYTKAEIDKLMFFEEDTSITPKSAVRLKEKYAGLYSFGFITAGGVGSSSGGGGSIDMARVWQDLTNNPSFDYTAYTSSTKIDVAHIPDITVSKVSDIETWIEGKGYQTIEDATVVEKALAEGIASNTARVSSLEDWFKNPSLDELQVNELNVLSEINGKIAWENVTGKATTMPNPHALTFGSDSYDGSAAKEITAASIGAATTARLDDDEAVIKAAIQSLWSQVDSVASRDTFDELTASALFSDVIAASAIYASSIELGGSDLATTLSGQSNRISTLEGYFSNAILPVSHGGTGLGTLTTGYALVGNGTSAVSLREITNNTSATAVAASTNLITANTLYYHKGNSNIDTVGTITSGTWHGSAIANQYIANHSITIGSTEVNLGETITNLTGLGSISAAGALTLTTTKRIYFGDTDHFIELENIGTAGSPNWVFHFSHGLYSDGFVTAGGVGSGGGGGSAVDMGRVWKDFTNNNSFNYDTDYTSSTKIDVAHIPDITVSKVSDIENWISNKGYITKAVNDLANYYLKTETYTQAEVNALIGAINQFHYEIYASISAITSPASNVLYLIGPTGSGSDKYEEYVYSNSTFVKIGDTSIDLSPYFLTANFTQANIQSTLGISNWALASSKPSYAFSEITGTATASQIPSIENITNFSTKVYDASASRTANTVLAAPNGSNGAATFRALVAADIPSLAISKITDLGESLGLLQAEIDAVSSRSDFDEINASALFADVAAIPSLYVNTLELGGADLAGTIATLATKAELTEEGRIIAGGITSIASRVSSLEDWLANPSLSELQVDELNVLSTINGNAASADKFSTARTLWGQSFDGTANVSGNMTGVGSVTATGLIKTTNYVQATRLYLSDSVYFVLDSNGVKLEGAGFYTDSFVTAGGIGSGGGGGSAIDMGRVWQDLTNNSQFDYNNYTSSTKIDVAHIPDITVSKISDFPSTWALENITEADDLKAIEDLSGTSGLLRKTGANTWQLDTSTYATLTAVGLLQTEIDSIASCDMFNELSASAFFADVASISNLYANGISAATVAASGNVSAAQLVSTASSGSPLSVASTTRVANLNADLLDGYEAADITSSIQSIWSQLDAVSSRNTFDELYATAMYIDTLSVGSAIGGDLAINGMVKLAGGTKKIWFGDSYYLELNANGLHTNAGFYADGFISAGGVGSGGNTYVAVREYDVGTHQISESEAMELRSKAIIRDTEYGGTFVPCLALLYNGTSGILSNINSEFQRLNYIHWIGVCDAAIEPDGTFNGGTFLAIVQDNDSDYYYYMWEV